MSQRTVYLDKLSLTSAWYALAYAVRGWRVLYFDHTPAGLSLSSAFARLLGRRFRFGPVDYQLGDYKGLYMEVVRLAIQTTEEWFRLLESTHALRWLNFLGQPERVEAYVKKHTLLNLKVPLIRMLIYERLSPISRQETRLLVDGSPFTRWHLELFRRITGRSPDVSTRLPLPSSVRAVMSLVRYYVSLSQFLLARGLSFQRTKEEYLLAKQAMWPVSRSRGDDFLVDGHSIFSSDLLIYYTSESAKSEPKAAVEAAKAAGYRTVAIDRVKVSLGWLWSHRTITRYAIGPVFLTLRSMFPGAGPHALGLVWLMLHLRRQVLPWDVFYERYSVRCLIADSIGTEGQAAATMAVHSHGGIAAAIQATENSDEFNELVYYVTCHYLFTWGEGVDGPWRKTWCVDGVVPAGYVWSHLHQQALEQREEVRHRYGVGPGEALIVVFDSAVAQTSFSTPASLSRFYAAAAMLAAKLDGTTVVIKPKNKGTSVEDRSSGKNGGSSRRLTWVDSIYGDTNGLIAAADLVVNMAHSSTIVEALICQVPAVAMDETGRDWGRVIGRPDALIFDNADELCEGVARILNHGLEPDTWIEIQEHIRQNFGIADGRAIDRVRAGILEACGVNRGTDLGSNEPVHEDVPPRPGSAG